MSPRAGRATEKAIGQAGESHTATAVPWDVGPVADTLDQDVQARLMAAGCAGIDQGVIGDGKQALRLEGFQPGQMSVRKLR